MIEALLGNTNYVAAKKMLDANVLRHQAIASNLANVETPGYKRLDVAPTFEAQLSDAVAGQDSQQVSSLQPMLAIDASSRSTREDGNSVTLESELLEMDKNMVEHGMETQMISASLMKLRMAITGKS